MARRPVPKEDPGKLRLALGGAILALLILLLATLVRTPLHPPYYDTISREQVGALNVGHFSSVVEPPFRFPPVRLSVGESGSIEVKRG